MAELLNQDNSSLQDKIKAAIAAKKGVAQDFSRQLFLSADPDDILARSSGDLAALADDAWNGFSKSGKSKYTVYVGNKPAANHKGGDRIDSNALTTIQISTPNVSFLLDSILGELHSYSHALHLVLHPIFNILRSKEGKIEKIADPGEESCPSGYHRESMIYIQISLIEKKSACDDLKRRLEQVLDDVHKAVGDWPAMQIRLAEAIATMKHRPPRLNKQDLAEAIEFLEWIAADNFTLLGMREYYFEGGGAVGDFSRKEESGLGLLSDPDMRILRRGKEFVVMTPEIREFLMRPEPLFVTKANVKSRVHRPVHMDYIGVKLFDGQSALVGELRIVGLFAYGAYARAARSIPYLRRKVDDVMERSGFSANSHSGRVMLNVLDSYPRDEFFQIDMETLQSFSQAILRLRERPKVTVLARRDRFDRFVSILCFVPRDRYTTDLRQKTTTYLADVYEGRLSAWYVQYPEGPLVRLHIIVGRDEGETPAPERETLEAAVSDIFRSWPDSLRDSLKASRPTRKAHALAEIYEDAFQAGYREAFSIEEAVQDIEIIEKMGRETNAAIMFRQRRRDKDGGISLNFYHPHSPIALSDRVPILENMGFRVINERTYHIDARGCERVYLHNTDLVPIEGVQSRFDPAHLERLEALFLAVWRRECESDGFNALVQKTDMDWRDVAILRALSRYLRQAGVTYSQDYIWNAVNRHPRVAACLVALFHSRFDPVLKKAERDKQTKRLETQIGEYLEQIESLDDDRILNRFCNLIQSILRTNIYQYDGRATPDGVISFKLDPAQISDLPSPRPFREIFVHSPRLEGLHLRFGNVARGGLRWSDRPQDFRTEILGLVKAQQVKNAVIVPVGAKGGFVPNRLMEMDGRQAMAQEGQECYKIFIASMLALTDNLKGGKIIAPARTVRYDDDDPYLVVAADKGTAAFSDTANAIAVEAGFWLDDAFASGGSDGYDHKKMGITARGAFEAVKRHFREMDHDILSQPFSAIGVGDMSGDVFGNGMLLSKKTQLLAAFDHRDIFLDPAPDIAASFAERERLFGLGRSSWQDYNRDIISTGGGIFSRAQKSIPLSAQLQAMLNIAEEAAAPDKVLMAILKMKADLLWFGGIGTYIRGSQERNSDVGDRANDAIRITAGELGAKVIGEGANLGLTQLARIEYGLQGGRCNSDAIDNSAGVNSSDLEVNIKIALGDAMREDKLDRGGRNILLDAMTGDVADLVLANNYAHTLAISVSSRAGMSEFSHQARMMRQLERAGNLNRAVEYLPDDVALLEREEAGKALTRAELGVLLAYGKLSVYDELLSSDLPDDPFLADEIRQYFPSQMREKYSAYIDKHRLKREISATQIANLMINRGGPAFITRIEGLTAASVEQIAKFFIAAYHIFDHVNLQSQIDKLDNKINGDTQLLLYAALQNALIGQTVYLLRHAMGGGHSSDIGAIVGRFRDSIGKLRPKLREMMPTPLASIVDARAEEYVQQGVPALLAGRIAQIDLDINLADIILISETAQKSAAKIAGIYFDVTAELLLGVLNDKARNLKTDDHFNALALDQARAAIDRSHRLITAKAIESGGVTGWRDHGDDGRRRRVSAIREIAAGDISLAKYSVAANLMSELSN